MVSTALYEITGGDETLMMQLLSDLRVGILKSITLLKNAETDAEWCDCAHRLKGGALAVGSDRIAGIATRAELDQEPRARLLQEIDAAFAEEFPG